MCIYMKFSEPKFWQGIGPELVINAPIELLLCFGTYNLDSVSCMWLTKIWSWRWHVYICTGRMICGLWSERYYWKLLLGRSLKEPFALTHEWGVTKSPKHQTWWTWSFKMARPTLPRLTEPNLRCLDFCEPKVQCQMNFCELEFQPSMLMEVVFRALTTDSVGI